MTLWSILSGYPRPKYDLGDFNSIHFVWGSVDGDILARQRSVVTREASPAWQSRPLSPCHGTVGPHWNQPLGGLPPASHFQLVWCSRIAFPDCVYVKHIFLKKIKLYYQNSYSTFVSLFQKCKEESWKECKRKLHSSFLFNVLQWVVCSTPHALSPDALSPHVLSPCALSPITLSPDRISENGLSFEKFRSKSGLLDEWCWKHCFWKTPVKKYCLLCLIFQ